MDRISLTSKAAKTDKPTIIKDDNGYYKVTLGALNTYNENGIFYKVDDLNSLVGPDTLLGKRLNNGILRSEYSHPETKGMDHKQIINRNLTIEPDRICGHLKAVDFVNTGKYEKGWEGLPIYIVIGWVKPSGPFGKYLEESLSNPDENTTFSIRSLAREKVIGTTLVRTVKIISTWDYVTEPGVSIASQWYAVGIENKKHEIKYDGCICIDGSCKCSIPEFNGDADVKLAIEKIMHEIELEEKREKPRIFNLKI